MRKIEIEGEVYRLPDELYDFQFELFVHLIKWKWNNLTKEAGRFGRDEYDAILPESEHENLPHLYSQTIKNALAEHLEVFPFKLHRHFFHMASSQAANINLFLPVLLQSTPSALFFYRNTLRFPSSQGDLKFSEGQQQT